jgi:hypothetical protein
MAAMTTSEKAAAAGSSKNHCIVVLPRRGVVERFSASINCAEYAVETFDEGISC